jgi:hypothetical protein
MSDMITPKRARRIVRGIVREFPFIEVNKLTDKQRAELTKFVASITKFSGRKLTQ